MARVLSVVIEILVGFSFGAIAWCNVFCMLGRYLYATISFNRIFLDQLVARSNTIIQRKSADTEIVQQVLTMSKM